MRISDEQIEIFQRRGYLVVPKFLTPEELAAGQADMRRYFPTADEYFAAPARYRAMQLGHLFPLEGDALNLIGVHEELLSFLERLLGTRDLTLGELEISAKYGDGSTQDQDLHVDFYGKNSIAYPRDEGIYRQVLAFVYLSDVLSENLAPTFVVSREHTRGRSLFPVVRSRADFPELYTHEVPVLVPAGGLLLFSMSTFHRGSALRRHGGARFILDMTYHATACRWMQTINWPSVAAPDAPAMRSFLERATPRQRELLGFPAPGDPYWNEETLAGVAERYAGLDLAPYRSALKAGQSTARR